MDLIWALILYLVAGAIIGAVARFLVPGEDPMPLWGTVLLGAVAAFLGGWLARIITPDNEGIPWIAAIITGVVLVLSSASFAAAAAPPRNRPLGPPGGCPCSSARSRSAW
jgi:uncharacterized membrane protein YeaQ/YmgE (transglycosylase-associated protein family)